MKFRSLLFFFLISLTSIGNGQIGTNRENHSYLSSIENQDFLDETTVETVQNVKEILALYEKIGDLTGQAAAHGTLGILRNRDCDYDNAIEHFLISDKLFAQVGNSEYRLRVACLMAISTFLGSDPESARERYKDVVHQGVLVQDPYFTGVGCLGVSRCFREKGDLDSTEFYVNGAVQVELLLDNCNSLRCEILFEKGNLMIARKDYSRAIEEFKLSYESSIDVDYYGMEMLSALSLADAYSRSGAFQLADSLYDIVEGKLGRSNDLYYLHLLSTDRKNHYDRLGDEENYFRYLELEKKYADSLANISDRESLNGALQRAEILRLENENLQSQNEIERLEWRQSEQEYRQLIGVIIFSSFIVFSGLILIFLLKNIKRKKMALEQNKQIAEYEKNLLVSQIEQKKLQTDKLSNVLELNQGKLTNFAMELSAMNQFSQKVLVKLQSIIQNDSKDEGIRELSIFLKNHLIKGSQTEELDQQIANINEGFFQRLNKNEIRFTPTEQSILGLIRLGMSSKEIAELKNLQVNSVEVYRHRLRKKLQLNRTENLVTYLREI